VWGANVWPLPILIPEIDLSYPLIFLSASTGVSAGNDIQELFKLATYRRGVLG